ncbi:MAG: A24 family peptidase [Protaetiibacter sp.]
MSTTAGQLLENRDRVTSRTWPVLAIYTAASLLLAAADLMLPASWYPWTLLAATVVGGGIVAAIDIRTLTLPNRFTAALAAAAAVQAVSHSIAAASPSPAAWGALAGVLATVVYLAMGLVGWVGFGDAKLVAGLAIASGAIAGPAALFLAPIAIAISGLTRGLHMLNRSGREGHPHGPALVAATLAVMILGSQWWHG